MIRNYAPRLKVAQGLVDLQGCDDKSAPALVTAWRGKERRGTCLARVCDLDKCVGTQEIDSDVEEICEDGECRIARE